jgi:hypothetical protein
MDANFQSKILRSWVHILKTLFFRVHSRPFAVEKSLTGSQALDPETNRLPAGGEALWFAPPVQKKPAFES